MRRILSLLLVCALLLPALTGTTARAVPVDNAYNSVEVWEWTQIKTQADFPAAGVYPLLIEYTDERDQQRYLKSCSIGRDDATIFRDGIYSGNESKLKKQADSRAEAEYSALSVEAAAQYTSLKDYREKQVYWNKAHAGIASNIDYHLYGGVNAIFSDLLSDAPQLPLEGDSFLTLKLPTKWELNVTGAVKNGEHIVRIYAGDRELADGEGYFFLDIGCREAELELAARGKGDDYHVYTSELGGDRQKYTEPGTVQIYYDDPTTGGWDTGLCWDLEEFGGVEWIKPTYYDYSNFTIFYGRKKTLSVLDHNHTVENGTIMYANDNTLINDGVVLNIAPGAILSVTGNLLLNGVINNCGTIILNPGATITSLEPERTNSGQINCYGAKSVTIHTEAGTAEIDAEIDPIEVQAQITELRATLPYLEERIAELNAADTYTLDSFDADGNPTKLVLTGQELQAYRDKLVGELDNTQARIAELQASLDDYSHRHADVGSDTTVSFRGCQGDILVMEGATLNLSTRSESRLNLYTGATCVNNGLIVAPNGITVSNSELLNRAGATIFCGYCFSNQPGDRCADAVTDPGTSKAAVRGLGKKGGSICALSLSDNFHVVNKGAILTSGSVSGSITNVNWEGSACNAG